MTNFYEFIDGNVNINVGEYSPLALAYIGDSVFDVYVRTMLLCQANYNVNKLHNMAKRFVSATAQSQMYKKIEGMLTDEEYAVLKRGRNAKSFTTAKNSSVTDYRHATGLEALFGYLYLKGEHKRMTEIFKMCIEEGKEN